MLLQSSAHVWHTAKMMYTLDWLSGMARHMIKAARECGVVTGEKAAETNGEAQRTALAPARMESCCGLLLKGIRILSGPLCWHQQRDNALASSRQEGW